MGCCSSKEIWGQVYIEMLRRLRVEPGCFVDAVFTERRRAEFEEMTLREKSGENAGGRSVGVEQLQEYDRAHWKLSSIHWYNEVLLVDMFEDVFRFNNGAYAASSGRLRFRDYRSWILCMCEFYRLMRIFETAKLLPKKGWEKVFLTNKEIGKCLKDLTSEFSTAFASDLGPGAAFNPPSSASPDLVVQQALNWSNHPLKVGDEVMGSSTHLISLVLFVRWLVLRHVKTLCSDRSAAVSEDSLGSGVEGKYSQKGGSTKRDVLWRDMFSKKQEDLRCLLEDYSLLERLFDSMTHGTRRLSEEDAMTGCYDHFEMEELFSERSAHDDLVRVAFQAAILNQSGDYLSCICSVLLFAQFLEAYATVLQLYHQVLTYCGSQRCMDVLYGLPVPDLEKEALIHVLGEMSNNDIFNGSENDDIVEHLFSSAAIEDGSLRVPFLVFADACVARIFGHGMEELSDLFHALGLNNARRRRLILSALLSKGWYSGDGGSTFDAMKELVNLTRYCSAQELECACSREQWVSEWEGRRVAEEDIVGCGTPSITSRRNQILSDIHLLRLLHGVYGSIVAVKTLAKISSRKGSAAIMEPGCLPFEGTEHIPVHDRLDVLHEASAILGIGITSSEAAGCGSGDEEDVTGCTASSLVLRVSRKYVDNQMIKYRRSALQRLQAAWPVGDDDARCNDLYCMLSQGGARKVFVTGDMTDEASLCCSLDLHREYTADLLAVMPLEEFSALCSRAVCAVRGGSDVCLTAEEIPAFMRYLLGYMQVLVSLGVPHDARSSDITTVLSLEECTAWLLSEAGIMMDPFLRAVFEELAGPGNDGVSVMKLAEWFALVKLRWSSIDTRLRLWTNEIRDQLPIRAVAADRRIRKCIVNEISEADDYIQTTSLTQLLYSRYKLWRVWPPELGDAFVTQSVGETNRVLQRMDLQGIEIHRSDLRFVLLFIHVYLDVLLHGECMIKEAAEVDAEDESEEKLDDFASSCISWTGARMRMLLGALLKDRMVDEETVLESIRGDAAGDGDEEPCTTSHLAIAVARCTVTRALKLFLEGRSAGRCSASIWDRLRQRLPVEDSLEQRLQRQNLFAQMKSNGCHYLEIHDLQMGMADVLGLREFRENLEPILFRAFSATKEVTLEKQDTVYLTPGKKQFLTAAEFRVFLCYVYSYFELYYMFDELCAICDNPSDKTVSVEAFEVAKPKLKFWGVRVDDCMEVFAGIGQRCKEEKKMYFSAFAEWASRRHLTPRGYSHAEDEDEDEDKNGGGGANKGEVTVVE